MNPLDWSPLGLTLKLAAITTLLLLLIGVPLAAWLAFGRQRFRDAAEAVLALPLVLPPTVLGFYLLLLFSPASAFGRGLQKLLHTSLAFNFSGLVIGSVLFSLPFMVQPLTAGFRQLPRSLIDAARTLGKSRRVILWRVVLPNCKPALLSGTVLAFAHTVGEFGVVLMLGGNIPGETRVMSIALYHEVEALNYGAAHAYAATLVAMSFVTLWLLYRAQRKLAAGKPTA